MEPSTLTKIEADAEVEVDAAMVEAARRDPAAFTRLYRRYVTPVYRYLYKWVGNSAEAEDLTAQVFTEVLEGLLNQRYREGGCFVAWLFTIARRRTVDFYRQRPVEQLADPLSPEPGLLAAIEKGEDLQRLARLLAQLDADRQELLRMRFSAGLSFDQIGQIEGRSETAVKMMVYRTLQHLRDQWELENA